MSVRITESEMIFGEYSYDDVFHIENSQQYKSVLNRGVKICEFILKKNSALYFVEAKTSCPKQIDEESPQERKDKYNEYIKDITNKVRDSLALYASILLSKYDSSGIPPNLLENDLSEIPIRLLLVVKNAKKEWLAPLKEKLEFELKKDFCIWKIDRFFVINEETARNRGIVV